MFYIYCLKHPITNEVRYIGQTNNPTKRFIQHKYRSKTSSTYLYTWWRSLCAPPIMTILAITSNEEDLNLLERLFIQAYPNLTNLTEGGSDRFAFKFKRQGRKPSQKEIDQLVERNKTRIWLEESRYKGVSARMSNPNTLAYHQSLRKTYEITFPDGSIEVSSDIKTFASTYQLQVSHLRAVARGERKHHKGFTVKVIKEI